MMPNDVAFIVLLLAPNTARADGSATRNSCRQSREKKAAASASYASFSRPQLPGDAGMVDGRGVFRGAMGSMRGRGISVDGAHPRATSAYARGRSVEAGAIITAVATLLIVAACGSENDLRFVDNHDGTVTDLQTGLMWELKDGADGQANAADPNDVDNVYAWSVENSTAADGTIFTEFLPALNNCDSANGSAISGGFAGHCDWRLPTISVSTIILGGGSASDRSLHRSDLRAYPDRQRLLVKHDKCRRPESGVDAKIFDEGLSRRRPGNIKDGSSFVRAVRTR